MKAPAKKHPGLVKEHNAGYRNIPSENRANHRILHTGNRKARIPIEYFDFALQISSRFEFGSILKHQQPLIIIEDKTVISEKSFNDPSNKVYPYFSFDLTFIKWMVKHVINTKLNLRI